MDHHGTLGKCETSKLFNIKNMHERMIFKGNKYGKIKTVA
jgi:hypothetical protein